MLFRRLNAASLRDFRNQKIRPFAGSHTSVVAPPNAFSRFTRLAEIEVEDKDRGNERARVASRRASDARSCDREHFQVPRHSCPKQACRRALRIDLTSTTHLASPYPVVFAKQSSE